MLRCTRRIQIIYQPHTHTTMKALFFTILILLVACGSKKTQLKEQRDIQEKNITSLLEASFIEFTMTDSILEKLKREKVYKITILSSPDSVGKQHPVSIEEGKVTEVYELNNLTKKDSTVLNNKKEDDAAYSSDKTKLETKESVDNRVIPPYAWWLIAGGVFAALLAWLAWKKK